MPMAKDKHEELLGKLLNPELTQSEKTDILQELRVDYGTVLSDHDTFTQQVEKLNKDNADLVLSNSKLFRQVGITGSEENKDEEKKEFSETVTIEQLEKGLGE